MVDVRERDEYEKAHVPGVRLIPMSELQERWQEIPTDQRVYVICQAGGRSLTAATALRQAGVDAVSVAGGTGRWEAGGPPGRVRGGNAVTDTVRVERDGEVAIVTIDRPEVRNAVDGPTALALADAFRAFDADDELAVAVLTGAGGTFCAGADLKAVADGPGNRAADGRRRPDGPDAACCCRSR